MREQQDQHSWVEPPVTGNRVIDQAAAEVTGLVDLHVEEHHDRLAAVQEVLVSVLDSSREAAQTPIPGVEGR